MIEAQKNHTTWWVNPNGHPLPTLPDSGYLWNEYLVQLSKSEPGLVAEAIYLLDYLGQWAEGQIEKEGGRHGVER